MTSPVDDQAGEMGSAVGKPGAHIIVSRPAGKYRDALRRYRIELDGEPVGMIGPGEDLIIRSDPGPHEIQARIDWSGSRKVKIRVRAQDAIRLVVRPAGSAAIAPFQVLSRTRYLILELA